eukprot:m.155620 g.155620  ORF g.155620 m.155620 type:complete len:110 (+) comp52915_c0_seq8:448-777(+)
MSTDSKKNIVVEEADVKELHNAVNARSSRRCNQFLSVHSAKFITSEEPYYGIPLHRAVAKDRREILAVFLKHAYEIDLNTVRSSPLVFLIDCILLGAFISLWKQRIAAS